MSLTKRIFIDKDPAYDEVRRRTAQSVSEHCAQFEFRVAGNRRNAAGHRPHWDPFWPGALEGAVTVLGLESLNINGGKFFRTEEERASVLTLAETLWRQRREAYAVRLARR